MMLQYIAFLVVAALLPPAVCLLIVYRLDRKEPEPLSLLISLFLRGLIAMIPIMILELLASQFVEFFSWKPIVYLFISYFLIPGVIEEGVKYRVLFRRTWQDVNFDHRFDGIVYAVFVSLGFAAVENVMYVLSYGFGTAVARALFSIPGHAMFGIVMGYWYGKARYLASAGQWQASAAMRKRGFLAAMVLHGLYDFLLTAFGGIFYVYFAVLLISVCSLLWKNAHEDRPI